MPGRNAAPAVASMAASTARKAEPSAGPSVDALPQFQACDVAVVHLHHDAEALQRRQLEQRLPGLQRRPDLLAEIARHHHAVEGRHQRGARQPLFSQRQLGFGLVDLGRQHAHGRTVGLGLGHLVAAQQLFTFGQPA